MSKYKLLCGDNMELLQTLPSNSVDSVVTDPPYGLSFMSKKWDYDVPSVEFWKQVYRVLKPGGHILAFGGTRTYHRLVVNIEDAGFEIRDQIQWLYGSGFPKSFNVGKVIHEWEGWGSALKPANEPICLARKPLSEKSIAENVLKWRTGGLNIDGCRVETDNKLKEHINKYGKDSDYGIESKTSFSQIKSNVICGNVEGRFPANLILDETAAEMLDEQSGITKSTKRSSNNNKNTEYTNTYTPQKAEYREDNTYGDSGGVSRFFYQAKVSKLERNLGLENFDEKVIEGRDKGQDERSVAYKKRPTPTKNTHPTIKPINLMTYLCRLITPPNGIVLDPFMGSGSTGIAALLVGFKFCGMEMDKEYFKISEARITNYEEYRKIIKK